MIKYFLFFNTCGNEINFDLKSISTNINFRYKFWTKVRVVKIEIKMYVIIQRYNSFPTVLTSYKCVVPF